MSAFVDNRFSALCDYCAWQGPVHIGNEAKAIRDAREHDAEFHPSEGPTK